MALLKRVNFVQRLFSVRNYSVALRQVNEKLDQELENIKTAGTWKAERVITSRQDVGINVLGSQGDILNFCANNYLGLSVRFFSIKIPIRDF